MARLEPLLPDQSPPRGGRWADHRQVLNGLSWRTRSGLPWRDLPPRYGHWKTVYNRYRRWSEDGTWVGILDELPCDADAHEGSDWTIGVHSGVVRARPARRRCPTRPPPTSTRRSSHPPRGHGGRHGGRGRITRIERGPGPQPKPGNTRTVSRRADQQDLCSHWLRWRR
jgi:Putative transposase of IS4/5 family (DUF4096)